MKKGKSGGTGTSLFCKLAVCSPQWPLLLGKAHPSQSPLRNVAAGPLTAETPRSPEPTLFLGSSHITVYHLHQSGFCSGPRPRNFGRGRETGACRKLPVPLLGQESKPCCGSHRNNKESLSWHRAESYRWIRRISRYAGVNPQAFLSPAPNLIWSMWLSRDREESGLINFHCLIWKTQARLSSEFPWPGLWWSFL